MILKRELLQYQKGEVGNNIYMFTANSTLNQNGGLVMGAGNAKAVRDTYVGIDKSFGNKVEHLSEFNVLFVPCPTNNTVQWIGAFQSKIDWKDKSPLQLVQNSVNKLKHIAEERPQHTFHLPCPAVNHGGRSKKEILDMLQILPDNVVVYLK